jgi:hypothetical protein
MDDRRRRLGVGGWVVDVGGSDLAQRVVEQHLADVPVDAEDCPRGTSDLVQMMTGPPLPANRWTFCFIQMNATG